MDWDTSTPLPTVSWGDQGARWVCVWRYKGLWGLVQEIRSACKSMATKSSVPNHPCTALMVSRELPQTKKTHRRSFLNMLIKEHKGCICGDFLSTSTEFHSDMWFKINMHNGCWLWGLYTKLIYFTDLGQWIFF